MSKQQKLDVNVIHERRLGAWILQQKVARHLGLLTKKLEADLGALLTAHKGSWDFNPDELVTMHGLLEAEVVRLEILERKMPL